MTRQALPEAYPNYDYDLHTNTWNSTNTWGRVLPAANGQWTIGIPDGAREVTVRVNPISGSTNQDWIEQEAAYFRLVTNANYAVAPPAPWATRGPGGEGDLRLSPRPVPLGHPRRPGLGLPSPGL
ncbi:MAG: hypothetical protein HS113_01910 [Verrucomicrobiales bacterium]|nr:hypothetical protein [Verrucomicrobiales bacterium]